MGKHVKRRARENCQARMVINLYGEGKWEVKYFDDVHSHVMVSPSKLKNIRSNKSLTSDTKELIEKPYENGIEPCSICQVVEMNLTFLPKLVLIMLQKGVRITSVSSA